MTLWIIGHYRRQKWQMAVYMWQVEKYKILILANMKALHYASMEKVLEFYRAGGIVIATGELPKASTRIGENDPVVDAMVREIFGLTAGEVVRGKTTDKRVNTSGGTGIYIAGDDLVEQIWSQITPDFKPVGGAGKALHRCIGGKECIYGHGCSQRYGMFFSELLAKWNCGMHLMGQL